jgi:hypothetical protein
MMKRAKEGNSEAQNYIGFSYVNAQGFDVNYKEGLEEGFRIVRLNVRYRR